MRIAIGGVSHAINTFFPTASGVQDLVIRRGEKMLPGPELGQLYAESGVVLVPTLQAGWPAVSGLVPMVSGAGTIWAPRGGRGGAAVCLGVGIRMLRLCPCVTWERATRNPTHPLTGGW